MKHTKIIWLLILLIASPCLTAQTTNPDSLLNAHANKIPALNEKVSISVNTSIREFIRGVANQSGLNIDIDPGMDFAITNNFTNVSAKDIIIFLAQYYKLDVTVIGNIITISKGEESRIPNVSLTYDKSNGTISLDVLDEDLYTVSKIITAETGKNVVPHGNARMEIIKCYIKDMPFDNAVQEMARSNGLNLNLNKEGFYVISKTPEPENVASTNNRQYTSNNSGRRNASGTRSNQNSDKYVLEIKLHKDSLDITIDNAPLEAILKEISKRKDFNYFLSGNTEARFTGNIRSENPEDVLTHLFKGSEITHKKANNIFIIGKKKEIDYNYHKVIFLNNRSVDKLLELLPTDFTTNLEVKEFLELNSLFVSGPEYQVVEFEKFIKDIDKVVPVVLIEVVILYLKKSINISTGIQAGMGEGPEQTGGRVFPDVNVAITSDKLNQILNGIGGINLGNLSPDFFIRLEAMESQGFLKVQSTPRLSTLNGHEASLSIGETEYYLEEKTELFGAQYPQQTNSRLYKAIDAELSINIRPVVSGDEQITLEIEVSQSDFTERITETAPPGTVNRKFTSLIRVKNQDVILLGGLNENRKDESGSGTPFLSRLPIIKWFFSSRKHERDNSKLSVLIKPTIIN